MVQDDGQGHPADGTIEACVLDSNHAIGLANFGSRVTASKVVVRNTQPQVSDSLHGIGVQAAESGDLRAELSLTSSLLQSNHDEGVVVTGTAATIERGFRRWGAPTLIGAKRKTRRLAENKCSA
jgi:hypothetical protein